MRIPELLTPRRIVSRMSVSSKKRMLEEISDLLHEDKADLDRNAVFQSLCERERLGSTAIGDGVALPHGRLNGLNKVVGAFATLAEHIDYDTADGKPVDMAFALSVPENATEKHLQILSHLATLFSERGLREQLLDARSAQEIHDTLTSYNSLTHRKAG